ncbi:hypothetical protein KC19_2G089300 [Ceratodon purpureus]|uniref:Uncharacterized protein n=1 Tax=Ceratodon purpureus TaxID=3225 RepID=A0A8T0IUR6_CERPU|nr:hypothetical protein KC19_2G089300 [Ceratodon purpureus]
MHGKENITPGKTVMLSSKTGEEFSHLYKCCRCSVGHLRPRSVGALIVSAGASSTMKLYSLSAFFLLAFN